MIETTTWLPDLFYSEMSTLGPSSLAEVIQQERNQGCYYPAHLADSHSPLMFHYQPLDCQSNCTSFDDLGNVQSPDHIAHCYTNTNIDDSARVFNGDVARAYDSSSTREHHLQRRFRQKQKQTR